jgi:hypothetical protein
LYYQEGWLATANLRGVVGVTFTASHCNDVKAANNNEWFKPPSRSNYNLRGHRSEVRMKSSYSFLDGLVLNVFSQNFKIKIFS